MQQRQRLIYFFNKYGKIMKKKHVDEAEDKKLIDTKFKEKGLKCGGKVKARKKGGKC
jgi:hypothetical protein